MAVGFRTINGMKCLIVMLNRCRLDYLGCYGNDWIATPTLDRLASESVVFDQHYASISPSMPSLPHDFSSGKDLLTAYVGDERCQGPVSRLPIPWESTQIIRRARLPSLEQESLLGGTIQTTIEWLQRSAQATSWMAWVDVGALIPPWDAAERDDEAILEEPEQPIEAWLNPPRGQVDGELALSRLEHTYAGVIGGVDQWLSMLLDFLREAGLLDEMTLIVTSDVGMALGDHGYFDPEITDIHEEHVHLPLVIRLPKGERGGRRVQQFTQPPDLIHAIAAFFGGKSKNESRLLSLAHGMASQPRDFITIGAGAPQQDWAIRTNQWYFVLRNAGKLPRTQLFVKPEDRYEVNNVASQHVAVAEHLELALRRVLAGDGIEAELRADVLNVLQS